MTDIVIPPAAALWAGALLLPLLRRRVRAAAFVFFSLAGLALVLALPEGARLDVRFLNQTLVLCRADALSRVFGIIFAFIAAAGGLYAFHVRDTGQQVAALLYAGGALGTVYAGDFFTFFLCWEVMAAASTFLVWAARNREARRAGFRYILYHLLGGGLLLLGIFFLAAQNGGNLEISAFAPGAPAAAWLILLGVAVNAAIVPLHTWLPDAYPRATVTGAVFLSAFTTKTAVYALARMFPGWDILLWAGLAMAVFGVFYAVMSDDIRGILSYHIISQVGFMTAGIGLGTEMGINGATAHAFNNLLYKTQLFMAAGLVLHTTGRRKLSELGGLGRSQPAALILYMIAAFSISGAPFFNGFVSKSLTIGAAGEAGRPAAMLLLFLASVGTFLSVGIKLPYFTWLSRDRGLKPERAPWNMYLAMAATAVVCILHGIRPGLLYRWLPYPEDFQPYTAAHLAETVQLLVLTLAAFWLCRRVLEPHAGTLLDFDWFFRRPAAFFRGLFVEKTGTFFDATARSALAAARSLASLSRNPYRAAARGGEAGYAQDRHRPTTRALVSIILAVFGLLAAFALLAAR